MPFYAWILLLAVKVIVISIIVGCFLIVWLGTATKEEDIHPPHKPYFE